MDNKKEIVSFKEALKVLDIEEYSEKIYNSNSHGELFHLYQYIELADLLKDTPINFRKWFEEVVAFAEKNWERPESVYQHIAQLFSEAMMSQADG